jgi:hypothetical protein
MNTETIETETKVSVDAQETFNPFLKLTAEEIAAIAPNKAFRDTNAVAIALAQTEFGISENDATFFAWLKSRAEKVIDARDENDAVTFIFNFREGVAFEKSRKATLALISERYNNLKVSLRKPVGIKVRDKINDEYRGQTAQVILDHIYSALNVVETDWMRDTAKKR